MASGEPRWNPTNMLNLSPQRGTAASFNDFAVSPRTATAMISTMSIDDYVRMARDADDAPPRKPPRIVRAPASVSAPASASCGHPCGASNAVD